MDNYAEYSVQVEEVIENAAERLSAKEFKKFMDVVAWLVTNNKIQDDGEDSEILTWITKELEEI